MKSHLSLLVSGPLKKVILKWCISGALAGIYRYLVPQFDIDFSRSTPPKQGRNSNQNNGYWNYIHYILSVWDWKCRLEWLLSRFWSWKVQFLWMVLTVILMGSDPVFSDLLGPPLWCFCSLEQVKFLNDDIYTELHSPQMESDHCQNVRII